MKSIRGLIFNHFFFAFSALFTLFAVITYFSISYYLERLSIGSNQSIVASVGTNIHSQLQGRLQNFDTLSSLKDFNPPEPANLPQHTLETFLHHEVLISTIHIYKKEGPLVYHARRASFPDYVPEKDYKLMKPSFVSLIESVINLGRPMLSEIYSGRHKRNYEIYVAPLFSDPDHKKVWGVISAAIFPHATDLSYMVDGLSLSEGNGLLLTDLEGNAIIDDGNVFAANPKFKEHWQKELLPEAVRWSAGLDPDLRVGQNFVQNDRTDPYIVISRYLPQSKAFIHLFIDRQPLKKQRRDVLMFMLACYVLSLVVGVGVAKVLSRRLADPVESIAETLQHFRKGNFSFRTPYKNSDDFQEIFGSLSDLGEQIERDHFIHKLWNPHDRQDT